MVVIADSRDGPEVSRCHERASADTTVCSRLQSGTQRLAALGLVDVRGTFGRPDEHNQMREMVREHLLLYLLAVLHSFPNVLKSFLFNTYATFCHALLGMELGGKGRQHGQHLPCRLTRVDPARTDLEDGAPRDVWTLLLLVVFAGC